MITAFFDTSENLVFFFFCLRFCGFCTDRRCSNQFFQLVGLFVYIHFLSDVLVRTRSMFDSMEAAMDCSEWFFLKKISFLATMCNKDLIILIKRCTCSVCDGTRRHACSSPDKRWSAFPKNNKNSGVGTYFSIIHLKKKSSLVANSQLSWCFRRTAPSLSPPLCREGDAYRHFHMSGCCAEWSGARACTRKAVS